MRPFIIALLTACTLLASGGCERANEAIMSKPGPVPLRLVVPDPAYRLDASERAKVFPGFDVAALERLLGMVRPELRQEILKPFQQREKGERVGHLMQIHDAELQEVLEEVWAPMWDEVQATDAQIEANHFGFPGRRIAKARREAGRNAARTHPE